MGIERKIVNRRIEELRKDRGLTQLEFAEKLGFEGKKGRSTINNWETGNIQVKSDDLILISETFSVSTDWLLGREPKPSLVEAISTASDVTGLSKKAVRLLNDLNTHGNQEEQNTISFINRVLSEPSKGAGTAVLDFTLFSWMEQYVTVGSVMAWDMISNKEIQSPGIKLPTGLTEGFSFNDMVKEFLMVKIKDGLDNYQKEQEVK